jgi:hypothetical protein
MQFVEPQFLAHNREQVKTGRYWFSRDDYDNGKYVEVWYSDDPRTRGWWVTPMRHGESAGHPYPLSVEVWAMLRSAERMRVLTGKAPD